MFFSHASLYQAVQSYTKHCTLQQQTIEDTQGKVWEQGMPGSFPITFSSLSLCSKYRTKMMTGRKIHHYCFFTGNDKMRNKPMDNFTQASKPITETISPRSCPKAVKYHCQRISVIHIKKSSLVPEVTHTVTLGRTSFRTKFVF